MQKVIVTGHGGVGKAAREAMQLHEGKAQKATACLTDLDRLILAGYDEEERTAILAAAEKYGVTVDAIMQAMVSTLQKRDRLEEMGAALNADPGNGPGTPNRAQRRAAKRKGRHKGNEPRKPLNRRAIQP